MDHVKVMVKNAGLPEVFAYGNIVGEFVAPIMVLIGFKTRIAGLRHIQFQHNKVSAFRWLFYAQEAIGISFGLESTG